MLRPIAGGEDQIGEDGDWGLQESRRGETKWTRSKGIGNFKRTWPVRRRYSVESERGGVEVWRKVEREEKGE
jgi:hypothetical protein